MLKAIRVVRKVDDLGRVVIPKEMHRTLGIKEGDPVEFYVNGDQVVVKKYAPDCVLCGSLDQLQDFNGKRICMGVSHQDWAHVRTVIV